MNRNLEKVLVCVEDVNLDEHVIEYAHMIAKTVGMKSVYLLHVIHDIPVEEQLSRTSEIEGMSRLDLDKKYQKEIERLTTGYDKAMAESAARHFGDLKYIEQHVKVMVGNQLNDTLLMAHENDIDLIVLGRHLGARLERGDAALLARRVTRKATCSVLTIPENFTPKLSKILCPVRNSDCSANALQTAVDLANAFNAEVIAMNLFHIYRDIHYPGGAQGPEIPLDVKITSARTHSERENEALRAKVKVPASQVEFVCQLDETFCPADVYERIVEERGCDLVVIGARGRTGAAGVLLGTITEQLIKQCRVPLLATKKKGEAIGLLTALMALFGKG